MNPILKVKVWQRKAVIRELVNQFEMTEWTRKSMELDVEILQKNTESYTIKELKRTIQSIK